MGRHTKLKAPEKAPEAPTQGARPLFDRAETMLSTLLGSIEATIAAGDISPALAREAGSVARAITTMEAERRNREAMEKRHARKLTLDDVIAFVRQLDQGERHQAISALQALVDNPKRSGLS